MRFVASVRPLTGQKPGMVEVLDAVFPEQFRRASGHGTTRRIRYARTGPEGRKPGPFPPPAPAASAFATNSGPLSMPMARGRPPRPIATASSSSTTSLAPIGESTPEGRMLAGVLVEHVQVLTALPCQAESNRGIAIPHLPRKTPGSHLAPLAAPRPALAAPARPDPQALLAPQAQEGFPAHLEAVFRQVFLGQSRHGKLGQCVIGGLARMRALRVR